MSELRGDPNHHSQLLESSDVEQNEAHEETASTIFRNLLEQARRAGKEPEDRQALAHVLESFIQEQMPWSPSIFNDLTLDEQLSIATAFSRIPEAQGNVSQIMVGELTYGLSFSDSGTIDFLREHIAKLPIEEKIDSILYLSTIFADAASKGYADDAADGIRDTLGSFETEANLNPFLRYAIQQTQAEIEEENENPSRGVVIRSGDKDIGRRSGAVTIKDRQEMAMLSRKIKPEGRVIKGYSLRVARDAIATVDHALFPQVLAFTSENFEAANHSADIFDHAEKLQHFIEAQPNGLTGPNFNKALVFAYDTLMPKDQAKGDFWHRLYDTWSRETWGKFWDLQNRLNLIQEANDEYAADQMQTAENKNAAASEHLVEQVVKASKDLMTLPFFQDILGELQDPDAEKRFMAASHLATLARYQPDAPPAAHLAEKLLTEVEHEHERNFQIARNNIESSQESQSADIQTIYGQILPMLTQLKNSDLGQRMLEFTRSILNKDERVTLTFQDYDDALPKTAVQLGEGKTKTNTTLLLQEIHRPPIKKGLETDLGVELKALSIREQLQLIPFLAEADPETQTRVFSLTKKFGPTAAQAFLSGEHGEQFFTAILSIGEQQSPELAQQIFDRYSEISIIAQEAVTDIASTSLPGTDAKLDPMSLQKELLARAKMLLESAAKPTAKEADILDALEAAKAETVLFASICKTYFKNNADAKLEDVKGVTLETKTPIQISPIEKDQILEIHAKNWQEQKPEAYPKLRSSLEKALSNETTTVYVMKTDDKITAFMRFDEVPAQANTLYAASLVVKPGLKGSGIGETFMRTAMDAEAEHHTLKADFFPEFVVGTKYVDEMGWVITGVEEVVVGDNQQAQQFTIERDDRKNALYKAKGIEHVDQLKGVSVQTFDVRKGTDDLVQAVAAAQTKGQVVTRYFADQQNPNLRTMVFEPAIQSQELQEAA